MGFNELMKSMFPTETIDGKSYKPGITSGGLNGFCENRKRAAGKPQLHLGVDINYSGLGQTKLNLEHPNVYSPVSGKIVDFLPAYNGIVIQDDKGYYHQFLHFNTTSFGSSDIGRTLDAGSIMGTMGNTGPGIKDQHLHYSMFDKDGYSAQKKYIDPKVFWNGLIASASNCDDPEIAKAKNAFQAAQIASSPIILDLYGDGTETTVVKAGTYFVPR